MSSAASPYIMATKVHPNADPMIIAIAMNGNDISEHPINFRARERSEPVFCILLVDWFFVSE